MSSSGSSTFCAGREHRHQIVELEDEADVARAPPRQLALRQRWSMRSPATLISPASGRSIPPSRLSRVVLPEPDGPITAMKSPRGTDEVEMIENRDRLLALDEALAHVDEIDHALA